MSAGKVKKSFENFCAKPVEKTIEKIAIRIFFFFAIRIVTVVGVDVQQGGVVFVDTTVVVGLDVTYGDVVTVV